MKRKIELPSEDEIMLKIRTGKKMTSIDALFTGASSAQIKLNALQEAYNQGYEDARPKWLPIETAPNDGVVVDLIIDGDRWPDCKFENGEWLYFSEYGDHMYDPDYYPLPSGNSPTHWMPLPPPPTL